MDRIVTCPGSYQLELDGEPEMLCPFCDTLLPVIDLCDIWTKRIHAVLIEHDVFVRQIAPGLRYDLEVVRAE